MAFVTIRMFFLNWFIRKDTLNREVAFKMMHVLEMSNVTFAEEPFDFTLIFFFPIFQLIFQSFIICIPIVTFFK